ncbi:hypothetical protein OHT52_14205 [Streptomyces sp. NBC_00247]|uniref:hypothetical protein n=1 Tax=Streptomyces sp. NBC_00247 TaxID=2975689 RepID=UPI002E2E39E4|nr:hypothetical protein [Streptomyces sp. NBC_00247]
MPSLPARAAGSRGATGRPTAGLPASGPPLAPASSIRPSRAASASSGRPSAGVHPRASGLPVSAASAPAGGTDASISTGPSTITPPATPLVPPSVGPSDEASTGPPKDGAPFAGRLAGEGRVRPGRSLTPDELASAVAALEDDDEETPPPAPASVAPPFPSSEPLTTAHRRALRARTAERLRGLSLGGGITLVGLGLFLLAVRVRRAG